MVALRNSQNFQLSDNVLLSGCKKYDCEVTMSNAHVSMEAGYAALCKNISDHAIALTRVKPTLWSARYNSTGILKLTGVMR